MTAITAHPFLDMSVTHDLGFGRRKEPETEQIPEAAEKGRGPSNKQVLMGTAAISGIFGAAVLAAMNYSSGLGIEKGEPVQRFQIATTQTSYQLPDDYPGTQSGERIVFYYSAPLQTDRTVERLDTQGCAWDVVTNRGNGKIMYPALAETGLHKCSTPGTGREPMRARMLGDNYPKVLDSSIKVVEVIDAATGDSMLARTNINPLSREDVLAAREERENLKTLENTAIKPNSSGNSNRTAAGTTPVRVAASPSRTTSRSAPASSRPRLTTDMLPTFDPRQPDIIRQVPQNRGYAAPRPAPRQMTQAERNVQNNDGDRMVSINPATNNDRDEMVSISKPPTDLRAITPLAPRNGVSPQPGGAEVSRSPTTRELPPVRRTQGYDNQ